MDVERSYVSGVLGTDLQNNAFLLSLPLVECHAY